MLKTEPITPRPHIYHCLLAVMTTHWFNLSEFHDKHWLGNLLICKFKISSDVLLSEVNFVSWYSNYLQFFPNLPKWLSIWHSIFGIFSSFSIFSLTTGAMFQITILPESSPFIDKEAKPIFHKPPLYLLIQLVYFTYCSNNKRGIIYQNRFWENIVTLPWPPVANLEPSGWISIENMGKSKKWKN